MWRVMQNAQSPYRATDDTIGQGYFETHQVQKSILQMITEYFCYTNPGACDKVIS